MPKASPIQPSFLGGEVSPLMYGRVDSERYKIALAKCQNYIPTIQGAITRRPASYYSAPVKDSTYTPKFIEFIFNEIQTYLLEFGNQYVRFYSNGKQIIDPTIMNLDGTYTTPYEIATPYLTNIIGPPNLYAPAPINDALKFTQSEDVLYLVHPSYAPRKLQRFGNTNWTLTALNFIDGPYMALNNTSTTFTCSAVASVGAFVTITANSTTGVNSQTQYTSLTGTPTPLGFQPTDVGRFIRMSNGASLPQSASSSVPAPNLWTCLKITAYTDATHVTAQVVYGPTSTTPTVFWMLGAYSNTTGWPACCCFYQDRLCFGGTATQPGRFDASYAGDYENFTPTDLNNNVSASSAFGRNLNSYTSNSLNWFMPGNRGIIAGSFGGEWLIGPADSSNAFSPTNAIATPITFYGSSAAQPVQVENAVVFVDRSTKKVRELTYVYYVDGYQAPDLSLMAPHLSSMGITQIKFQRNPQPIVWAVRSDGMLLAMTYERDLDALKVAWSRHLLGGVSDVAGNPAAVEQVAVVPSIDGTQETVYLLVRRYINGGVVRYVEVLSNFFDDNTDPRQAFFVDGGLTYDLPKTITGLGWASPSGIVEVDSPAHGFSNGDRIYISDLKGAPQLNNQQFIVADVAANFFHLKSVDTGNYIDATNYTPWVRGGYIRKMVSTISGLGHLVGQTVSIIADGAAHAPKTVAFDGTITLDYPASIVSVGLGYNSDGQQLRPEAGAADGTSMGKTRRTNRVGVMVHRSMGLKVGMSFDDLEEVNFRTGAQQGSRAVPLFSGIISENIDADYDFENQFCWRQDLPLPSTILAVMPQLVTQDRG